MVSLVDIIDVKKTVTVRGKEIEVEGINAEKLGQLINAYPDLRLAFAGRAEEMSAESIIRLGPKIVAGIIAAAIGKAGDAAEEAAAAKLTIGEQVTVLSAVVDVTFPDGFGPFVVQLKSLGILGSDEAGAFGKGPVMNSQRQSSPSPGTAGTADAPPS